MSGISGHRIQPGDELGTPTGDMPHKLAEGMSDCIIDLCDAVSSECTMDEFHSNEPLKWLTLFNRMGEEQVDAIFERITNSHAAYMNYFDESEDHPPGVPRH